MRVYFFLILIYGSKKDGVMARKAPQIDCSQAELRELNRIIAARKSEQQLALRAKIILLSNDEFTNKEIAKKLKTSVVSVGKWRRRFKKSGMEGLVDAPRPGRPQDYTIEDRNKILKLLEEPPPKGQSCWDGKSLAERLNFSSDYVWRILRNEGIQLQRKRTWCVSTDPEFAPKAANIIGLYLNPPENALVICVDEKPSIQALERQRGYVYTRSKKIVQGLQSTYKRHGSLNLFAALIVATGVVKTKTTKRKKREDFLAFMDDILKDVSKEQEVHVILDNYSTHKNCDKWLISHPNVHFHYTPTSASWLNQVEIWFGILEKKALKNASFSSIEDLKGAIEDFIDVYHENAHPFVWKKREVKGSQLRNTIRNLCN